MSCKKCLQVLQAPCFVACHRPRIHDVRPPGCHVVTSNSSFPNFGRIQSLTSRAVSWRAADGFDPYAYTSGRWLRNDKHEREMRRIHFDFDSLCQKVLGLSNGADSIRACEKKEGGFNRVFIFTMDDGSRLVARLPLTFAGPSKLATASEVATTQYLQRKTSIPIPKVLDWSDDAENSVGSEYIIMEHAAGTSLDQIWAYMSGVQKIRCIDNIYRNLKQMTDIAFPAYGSLYFSTTPLGSHPRLPLDGDFCLGPHCGTRYWNFADCRYHGHACPSQGPWPTVGGFSNGLIDAGLSKIPPTDPRPLSKPSYHGSISTHLALLEQGRTVLDAMATDSRVCDASTPALFHPDLHKRNIFVSQHDPSVITGIIDWQSCSVEPAFWYAEEVPDFAVHTPSPISSTERIADSELCAKAHEVCTQLLMPKLALPKMMNENLFRPFRYCYRTWKDGAVAFRYELIETSREWGRLGFAGPCPFQLPELEELALHQKEYRRFVAAQNLKRDLSSLLDCATDGWVPPENWEVAKRQNEEMFQGMLNAVLTKEDPEHDEPVRDEKDLREIWPFDLPPG